jgi:hypothetical protein
MHRFGASMGLINANGDLENSRNTGAPSRLGFDVPYDVLIAGRTQPRFWWATHTTS